MKKWDWRNKVASEDDIEKQLMMVLFKVMKWVFRSWRKRIVDGLGLKEEMSPQVNEEKGCKHYLKHEAGS